MLTPARRFCFSSQAAVITTSSDIPTAVDLGDNVRVSKWSAMFAGPYGLIYDYSIEREWLMRAVGRAVWGIDMSAFYASMEVVDRVTEGATILDVPCGGGVAFRALRPNQNVRYIAVDLSEEMLARARQRAMQQSLSRIEFAVADMRALPFADEQADLFLSYNGLHMLDDPERAVTEITRCLKPGGELVGTTLLAEGSWQQQALIRAGRRRGFPVPPSPRDLRRWLTAAGIAEPVVEPDHGLAVFRGYKMQTED